jgi:hypothetical protein
MINVRIFKAYFYVITFIIFFIYKYIINGNYIPKERTVAPI